MKPQARHAATPAAADARRTGAMLPFQLMTRHYERASTVLTSNKGVEEWGEIFGDEVMAAALLDRFVHTAILVTIRGNSYRMRQHTDLWPTLQQHQTRSPRLAAAALVRRLRRTEIRSVPTCRDFQSAELSEFRPASTCARFSGTVLDPRTSRAGPSHLLARPGTLLAPTAKPPRTNREASSHQPRSLLAPTAKSPRTDRELSSHRPGTLLAPTGNPPRTDREVSSHLRVS
jgi:hypothetical protein